MDIRKNESILGVSCQTVDHILVRKATHMNNAIKTPLSAKQPTNQKHPRTGSGSFTTIYADPPWDICGQRGGRYGAINHYELMPLDRIKAMPIQDLAADNSVCFLWICNGMHREGEDVLKAWGFRPISEFQWIKPRIGLGNYFRYASETCLLGVRGSMLPKIRNQPNWGFFPVQDHSHKPEEFYAIMERMYPEGRKLELFARRRPSNPEWYCWGLECPDGSDIYIPGYPVPSYSSRVQPPVAMVTQKGTGK